MKSKELEMNEIKRKERAKYNTYYNKTVLETFNLLIEHGNVWFSSIDLANISGRNHRHVLRDIERDILQIYDNLGLHSPLLDAKLRNLRTKPKTEISSNEIQRDDILTRIVNEVNELISDNEDDFDKEVLSDIKVETRYRLTEGGRFRYYVLNRQATFMCLMRYSPVVRAYVSNLFFKSVDMLKSKGHEVKSAEDMYMSIDEEINNSIETLEEDLKEGEKLSQFNMWHLFFLLLNKIPPVLTKYFMKEFPSFDYMKEMAERFGDFTSSNFIDPDKKGKGGF